MRVVQAAARRGSVVNPVADLLRREAGSLPRTPITRSRQETILTKHDAAEELEPHAPTLPERIRRNDQPPPSSPARSPRRRAGQTIAKHARRPRRAPGV